MSSKSILDDPNLDLDKVDDKSLTPEELKKYKILKAKAKAKQTKAKQKELQDEKEKNQVEKWTLPPGEKYFKLTKWFAVCLWEYKVIIIVN